MGKAAQPKRSADASTPLSGSVVGRVSSKQLEAALRGMPRTEEQTKERMRAHFVQGLSLPEIAAREGIGVEGVANAARRVRAQLAALANPESTHRNSRREAVIVRARAEDLEQALSGMSRMEEQTKDRMRAYFVGGMSMPEIAARDGVRVEAVANAVRRVRDAMESEASPWQPVQATMTLPLVLAQELQALSDELVRMPNRGDADNALKPVLGAIVKARKLTQTTQ